MRGLLPALALLPFALACGSPGERPNFVLVILDDARPESIPALPVIAGLWDDRGIRFDNAFTPNSTCCPSRVSILTGLSARRHGVKGTRGPEGGEAAFRESGYEEHTLAVWLQAAGYRTGLFGKYLNGYATAADRRPDGSFRVPPGWSDWWVFTSPPAYGGARGRSYGVVDETGRATRRSDYSTDRSAAELRAFVTRAAEAGEPFLAIWAPLAPHAGAAGLLPVPAQRHAGRFDHLRPWRPPSWNEEDVSDKPRWVREIPVPSQAIDFTDEMRRRAFEALLAVDELLGRLLEDLESLGVADHSFVIVTSDNGASWGEHRLFLQRKGCPYDPCQRVPLWVMAPFLRGSGRHQVAHAVLNTDLAPTVADLAGVTVSRPVDGRSLRRILEAPEGTQWERDAYVIEYWHHFGSEGDAAPGWPPDHFGLYDVARGLKWIEYATGERELYDLRSDPHELVNRADDPELRDVREDLRRGLAERLE